MIDRYITFKDRAIGLIPGLRWALTAATPTTGDVLTYNGTEWVSGIRTLTGTATWDPGLIADNADTATNLTVTGAAVGDAVTVGLSTLTTQDAILSATVQATNDVRVMLSNRSGGNLDLTSGTVRVVVFTF